jgi:hypothetical protein
MRPGERGRHCARCEKHVYDLSAMTEQEARALLDGARGEICVSYLHDRRGGVVFRQPALVPATRLLQRRPVAHAALSLALAACAPHASTPSPQIEIAEQASVPELAVIPTAADEPSQREERMENVDTESTEPAVEPRHQKLGKVPLRRLGGKPLPRTTGTRSSVSRTNVDG